KSSTLTLNLTSLKFENNKFSKEIKKSLMKVLRTNRYLTSLDITFDMSIADE
ncbi:25209_t:CDS:1, partial [Cetraspora pellucida]